MSHKQFAQEQRYQIYALKKAGVKNTEIANILQVHKSTVCRELKRNTGGRGYRPRQAHSLALSRKRNSIHRRITHAEWILVEELIEEDWSPEQISCWLKMNTRIRLSHEWIYQYIRADRQSGGTLYTHLRCRKKRRKKYGSCSARGQIPDRISIDKRQMEAHGFHSTSSIILIAQSSSYWQAGGSCRAIPLDIYSRAVL